MSEHQVKIGNVLHPVADVADATRFYRECLGLGIAFADGGRFAALSAGNAVLALAGPAEDVTEGAVAASFKVADVHATVREIVARGGEVVRPPERGPHEIRAVVRDPWANAFVLYSSLT